MNCDKNDLLLYAVTDRHWLDGRRLIDVVRESLDGGVTMVQLREKTLEEGKFLEEAKELQTLCRERGVPFLVNDNVEIAREMNADGVHVGQEDLPVAEVRALIGPDAFLGLSVTNLDELADVPAGVDYLGIGPVYPTGSKPDAAPATGVAAFATMVAAAHLPVVAIGGIHAGNCAPLFAAGAQGIAVISAICGQTDPARATRDLRSKIEESRSSC